MKRFEIWTWGPAKVESAADAVVLIRFVCHSWGTAPPELARWADVWQPETAARTARPLAGGGEIEHGMIGGLLSDPSFSYRALGTFLKAYGKLGVDLVVLGFSNHIVELHDGRRVYCQAPVWLKKIDEDMDGAFFNRLVRVIESPPRVPGATPACFLPLMPDSEDIWNGTYYWFRPKSE